MRETNIYLPKLLSAFICLVLVNPCNSPLRGYIYYLPVAEEKTEAQGG